MTMLTASEVPALMDSADDRGPMIVLSQFVRTWNRSTRLAALIAAPPDPDATRRSLAAVAAVVHSLADRDGVAVPGWVHQHQAERYCTITGVDLKTDYGRHIRASSPPVSEVHRVYFESDFLDAGR